MKNEGFTSNRPYVEVKYRVARQGDLSYRIDVWKPEGANAFVYSISTCHGEFMVLPPVDDALSIDGAFALALTFLSSSKLMSRLECNT